MAEATPNSFPVSEIKNFLDCSICCGPFDDPRALPCLHTFCHGCLENWAKSCSPHGERLSCPLCKKEYTVPENGFPPNFIVASQRDTFDSAEQKKSIDDLCVNHGKKNEYFCEDCHGAACSDCAVLDPNHNGHHFIQLREEAQQQSASLEMFTTRIKDIIEQDCMVKIRQTQKVKEELTADTSRKIKAINDAKVDFLRQVECMVRGFKDTIYHKRDENMGVIQETEDVLCADLATTRNSYELARNVLESGSDSDVISCFPALVYTFQELLQLELSSADSTLAEIQLDSPLRTRVILPSLEWLVNDKLGLSSINTTPKEDDQAISEQGTIDLYSADRSSASSAGRSSTASAPEDTLPAASPADPSLAPPENTPVPQKDTTPESKQKGRSSGIFRRRSKSGPRKQWKECGQFKVSPHAENPCSIAVHSNRDICVSSSNSGISVFSRKLSFKHVVLHTPSGIHDDVAVTLDNQYIILDKNMFLIFDRSPTTLHTVLTLDVHGNPGTPSTVTVDSTGRIIVRLGKTVLIHQMDGTLISNFTTSSYLNKIACTPDDRRIVSLNDNTLQVMDQSGRNTSIIEPPHDIQSWVPAYMCCSKQGELFVGNHGEDSTGVYRYVASEGTYEYKDCVTWMEHRDPWGLALSADEEKLFVVDKWSSVVKIFK